MIEYGSKNKYDEYNQKCFHDECLHQLSSKQRAIQTYALSNGILVGIFILRDYIDRKS